MEAVEDVGGRLHCLKKSFGFQQWAQRTKARFFMLLADWREVKPSADFLAQAVFDKPHVLVVYTENEKQYKQALSWASWLPANGYSRQVYVLEPNYTGKELALRAAELLQELVSAEKEAPQRGVQVNTWTPQVAAFVPVPPTSIQVVVNCCADLMQVMPLDQQRLPCRTVCREEPGFIAMEGHSWVRPVVHVLASIFPFATREQIKTALRMVEPVYYED